MILIFIQFWRWIMQPKVWRFVGFASAVVGLLCYALSSSFNYLFGSWNLWKILLYTVFSFLICSVILFAKSLQHSTSLRFRAHTAFVVLAMTSLYSFFFDKVVNGKPDAYSLISCASFAIMSLSLSRQTRCGFEIDLLYFFLGCFIVQLMKIKLQLFIVGAAFSYSLIIIRSSFSSIDDGENNQYSHLQDGNSVVLSMDSLQLTSTDIASTNNDSNMGSSQLVITTDISSMMEQLRTFVTALRHENSNFIHMLLEHVKTYVEKYSEMSVTDPNFMMDALKSETIKGLEQTAKVMMSAGFEKNFSDVYINCRRECLNECLMHSLFGLQKLSVEDVHNIPWNILEAQIERWIRAFNVALKILFPGERQICDQILFGSSSAADFSFTEICRESTIQLLSFAESVAFGSRSPEHLFKMIEVFETLRHLIPDFESIFCGKYSVSLRNVANTIWKRLGEAIRDIFIQLKELYRQEHRNVDTLESNLNARSKLYNGSFSGDIFLMNNDTYMIPIAKDDELGTFLGNDWIRQYARKVLHYDGQHNMGAITPELAHEVSVKDSEASKGNEIELREKEAPPSHPRARKTGQSTRILVISLTPQFGSIDKMQPEDVFPWRKYGTKKILGSKYPRSYYRCSNTKLHAFRAKKQVKQLGDNPNVFEVRYHGEHSCNIPLIRPAPEVLNISKDMSTTVPPPHPSYDEWLSSATSAKSINSMLVVKAAAPADGGYHPMMESIGYYLVSVIKSVEMSVSNGDGAFSFSAEMEKTIEMLESIFVLKSEKYVDPSLRHFFTMNNWRYLEMANQRKELLETAVFGNVWIQKSTTKVQEKLELYQKSSWDKVLEYLKLDINESMEPNIAVNAMKEKLSLFNMHFTETCRVQWTWSVHDEKLRRIIIASLKNILLPAYGIFIGRFQDIVKNNAYEYIEYGMFDIQDVLDNLFLGNKKDN